MAFKKYLFLFRVFAGLYQISENAVAQLPVENKDSVAVTPVSVVSTGDSASPVAVQSASPVSTQFGVDTTVPPFQGKYLPEIGFGSGLMAFRGDVGYKHITQPVRYKLGYNLFVQKAIYPFLDVSVFLLYGRLYGNERDTAANNNFESKLLTVGVAGTYNFKSPFYRKATRIPVLVPYFSLGIEWLSFDTGSDLKDIDGKTYYYWNEIGYIKDKPENSPDASKAKILVRDYSYETRYPKKSTISVPLGLGATFYIANRITMNIGSTLHLTQSDLIDNVENGGKDKFLFSSVAFRYNFGIPRFIKPEERIYYNIDFKALDKEDSDGDSIVDLYDLCPGTPYDVKVDEKGCPFDDDKDGVPNYIDKEENTVSGAVVDEHGITITDEYIAKKLAEMDSLRAADTIRAISYSKGDGTKGTYKLWDKHQSDEGITFKVQIGKYKKDAVPMDVIDRFMDIQDISTKTDENGMITFASGKYGSKLAAEHRLKELNKQGISNTAVVAFDASGKPVDINKAQEYEGVALDAKITSTSASSPFPVSTAYNIEYRVQLGIFTGKLPQTIFTDVDNLSTEAASDSSTRYMAGSFTTYQKAAEYKMLLRQKSFPDAFVVAYRGGKRVTLKIQK